MAAVLYPIWGYLYDRYSRRILAGLAAMIWGFTTIFNALSRTFDQFFATRMATGVDDAAPPGIYSLVADYFEPYDRGKAMGIINASSPIGAILGTILALSIVSAGYSWRNAFYITGPIGVLIGVLTILMIKDIPRGSSEPELEGLLTEDLYKARLSDLPKLLKNRSLLLLYLQGFWGVFPWNAITFWIITYMELERGLDPGFVMVTMVSWLIAMTVGNIFAGYVGDKLFKRTKRGRAMFGAVVVLFSAILIYLTINAPTTTEFFIFGLLTAFEIPMAGPNVSAAITDVTEPELRASATGYLRFFENIGSAVSPALTGFIAEGLSLGKAIMLVSVSTWLLCFIFFTILAIIIPKDIDRLRSVIQDRKRRLTGE
ncbi:MAG: MFS transporter [Infirmifilum sp.]